MYENMLLALVLLVAMSNQWSDLWALVIEPAKSSLFFVIFSFLLVAVIFDATDVVGRIVKFLLSLVGRFRGGSGYVATMASAFMASLSGSGPGNAAAVGTFTIPMMKRAGFTPHMAATIEMSASMLGNIIPPAGIIFLAYGVYDEQYPGQISLSAWTLSAAAIGLWFLLQKLMTLYIICRVIKVDAIPVDQRPHFREALKEGWPALILPVLIFAPLVVDFAAKELLVTRLGEEGASQFSSAVLMFTPGIAALYAVVIGRKSLPTGRLRLAPLLDVMRSSLRTVVPVAATVYFAYAISAAFVGIGAQSDIEAWVSSMDLNLTLIVIIIPLVFALLGMVLPGTAQVAILGASLVAAFAAAGGNPLLIAVMLPAMTGALEGMTPPLALGLFITMGIADSEFGKTVKCAAIWITAHLAMSMVLLAGLLPIANI